MSTITTSPEETSIARRQYKYLDPLVQVFVVVLLISNLVGGKITPLGPFSIFGISFGPFLVSGAQLLFPITYIFGDIFTEVYGYGTSRGVIWTGFFASILLALMGLFAIWLPPAPQWQNQHAFEVVFGLVPRIVLGSLIAYWAGEFANSFTIAKLKLVTNGKYLWTRTVGSTVVGQAVDTAIVMSIIFWDQPFSVILNLIVSGYLFKVIYEVLATPLTYLIVGFLKRQEGVDTYDRHTNFSPFHLR